MSQLKRSRANFPRMKNRAASRLARPQWHAYGAVLLSDQLNRLGAVLVGFRDALIAPDLARAFGTGPAVIPAPPRAVSPDLLTIVCMDARHDSCEGDFCECACHDFPAEVTV